MNVQLRRSVNLLIVSMVTCIYGDFDCVCNYAVEKAVFASPDSNSQPIGYLYEFDCKPETAAQSSQIGQRDFFEIQYEKQVGYVSNARDVEIQICPGTPSNSDLIPTTQKTTSKQTTSTTTTVVSTVLPSASTIKDTTKPTTMSTVSTPSSTIIERTTTLPLTTTTPFTISTSRTTKISTTPARSTKISTTPRTTISVPVTWPVGTYGLMQTAQGCPAGNTRWATGWRKQDTEDSDAHNYFTNGIGNFLGGEFHSNNLVTRFCIKDISATSAMDKPWPQGSYCILKHHACPAGFRSGFIHWDDEDISNSNSRGGALPDGNFDGNTQIYYCCRGDGRPQSEISLPTERPFILVRYGSLCQSVRGMNVRDVFVRWDDEDTLNTSGKGGWHPTDSGGSKDHLLHFCYYHLTAGPSLIG